MREEKKILPFKSRTFIIKGYSPLNNTIKFIYFCRNQFPYIRVPRHARYRRPLSAWTDAFVRLSRVLIFSKRLFQNNFRVIEERTVAGLS